MFNIGSFEVLLICVIALLVLGPERLPSAVRTAGLWIGRFRRSFYKVKSEIERELNADDIRRQLHNESVLAELESAKESVETVAKDTQTSVNNIVNSANFDPGASKFTDDQVAASDAESEAVQPKSITEEIGTVSEEIGAVSEEIEQVGQGIKKELYGLGKNPKLADNIEADSTPSDQQANAHVKDSDEAAS
jgi:sec-independent protein translocase protein TatB